MILFLRGLFLAILITIVSATAWASFHVSLADGGPLLLSQPWGVATLFDTYLAFLTFYVWLCYKERSLIARVIWFVLVMTLGNIAMSFYVLMHLFRLPLDARIEDLLLRREKTV